MRLAVILVVGCSYQRGAASGGVDAPAPDAGGGRCGGKQWHADFSSDPTMLDQNGDGVPDWALRDGTPFPVDELGGGVWSEPAPGRPLDTQPKQPFVTRTLVHGRMRGTAVDGARGAVFWINVGYDVAGTFAPVYVDAKLQADTSQTLSLWTKTSAGVEVALATLDGFSNEFIDFDLDIDPGTLAVRFATARGTSTFTAIRQSSSALDQWATVVAYSTAAEFDDVRIEVCP